MTQFPYKIIDLTHTLEETTPSWHGSCGFKHEVKLDYCDCETPVKFRVQQIKMHAGIGTHIDAPSHCVAHGKNVEELALENLAAPCVMIDVSGSAHAGYSVTVQDIEAFEKTHGVIEEKSFVIVRTGWEKFWSTPTEYRNDHMFPSVSYEAAILLLQRHIAGLGIDTLSPDRPESGYPVHAALLGAGCYIVENVANSASLPPKGSFTLALPIKTKGGTEAPIRLVGLLPKV